MPLFRIHLQEFAFVCIPPYNLIGKKFIDRSSSVSPLTPSISPQPQMVITHSSSIHEGLVVDPYSPPPSATNPDDAEHHHPQKVEKSNSFRFKDFRKRSKESLSFRRRKRKQEPMSLDSSMLAVNHPYSIHSTTPTSPRSPCSPSGQCRCRRCSLLPLEECEPKEVSALFKFLRKSKVIGTCDSNLLYLRH